MTRPLLMLATRTPKKRKEIVELRGYLPPGGLLRLRRGAGRPVRHGTGGDGGALPRGDCDGGARHGRFRLRPVVSGAGVPPDVRRVERPREARPVAPGAGAGTAAAGVTA